MIAAVPMPQVNLKDIGKIGPLKTQQHTTKHVSQIVCINFYIILYVWERTPYILFSDTSLVEYWNVATPFYGVPLIKYGW